MIVYLLTCLNNGKRYVGISIQTLDRRWHQHLRDAKRNNVRAICRAIRKHGAKNFKVETLERVETIEQLRSAEIKWIRLLNTKAPNGYNLTSGGDGVMGLKWTQEQKANAWPTDRRQRVAELFTNSPRSGFYFPEINPGTRQVRIKPGDRFQTWLVIQRAGTRACHSVWECRCVGCGASAFKSSNNLRTLKNGCTHRNLLIAPIIRTLLTS